MKLPSSTEVYLAMIPRRSSLVSCFGSGSESMSSSMIAVVWSSINATGCARRVVIMWISREVGVVATSGKHVNGAFMNLGMVPGQTHQTLPNRGAEEQAKSLVSFSVVDEKT